MIARAYIKTQSEKLTDDKIEEYDFLAVVCHINNGDVLENIYDVHKGEYIFKKWVNNTSGYYYFLYNSLPKKTNVFGIGGSKLSKNYEELYHPVNYYSPGFRSYLLENII